MEHQSKRLHVSILLAALYLILGPGSHMVLPLALNIVLAALFIVVADRILQERVRGPGTRMLVLILAVVGLPLAGVTYLGMEHVLHLLLSVLVIHYFTKALSGVRRSDTVKLLLLLPLLCTVRIEGLFFLPPLLAILIVKKRKRLGGGLLLVSVLPLVAFGAFSVSEGGFLLPNPVVIKGVVKAKETLIQGRSFQSRTGNSGIQTAPVESSSQSPSALVRGGRLAGRLIFRFVSKPWVLCLLFLTGWFFLLRLGSKRDLARPPSIFFLVFASVACMHVVLAGAGIQYRYEVYVMGMGIVLLGESYPCGPGLDRPIFSRGGRKSLIPLVLLILVVAWGVRESPVEFTAAGWWISLALAGSVTVVLLIRATRSQTGSGLVVPLLAIAFVTPILARGMTKQIQVPRAAINIHDQQIQMGRFIAAYYGGKAVAVNDIGAVAYFGNATVVDLWGLGDNEVLLARLRGVYDSAVIDGLLERRDVSLVVVYERWFDRFGGLPKTLKQAAVWEVGGNVVLGGTRVSFFSRDEQGFRTLISNLREYEALLPGGVTVRYTQDPGS